MGERIRNTLGQAVQRVRRGASNLVSRVTGRGGTGGSTGGGSAKS